MKIVIFGLSITSSWGNGHATNYRALVREMARRGHDVLFCERDVPWYAAQRDLPAPPWGETSLYTSLENLARRHGEAIRDADLTIIGSYVPEGSAVARWILARAQGATAFYDIDTPITLAKLAASDLEYLTADLIPRFDLYLSFTAGPTLERLRDEFGARRPLAFYCLADPFVHHPVEVPLRWDLGYLGTYSADRQAAVESLLLDTARRLPARAFAVAGPGYPEPDRWPGNVNHIEHLPPNAHPAFYCAQRFTLNVTRAQMRRSGWSPSVRLFEAAACGVPVISDRWAGLDELLIPGEEILIADDAAEVRCLLAEVDETTRRAIGERARRRVLEEHTPARRVEQLEVETALCAARSRSAA